MNCELRNGTLKGHHYKIIVESSMLHTDINIFIFILKNAEWHELSPECVSVDRYCYLIYILV
jgi:hypothetical protein